MARPKRVLFFTNSDFGQANVVLATAHALIHNAPGIEIHVASFGALETAVKKTSDYALETAPQSNAKTPITFHRLDGVSWGPATFRPGVGIDEANNRTPNLINSAKTIFLIPSIMLPWHPDEFTFIYHQSSSILSSVNPSLTIIEPLFTPGLTLLNHLSLPWLVLAPNTLKDFALPFQPHLSMLWKYPMTCSALPFPLPLHLVPYNILLSLVALAALLLNPRPRALTTHLRKISPSLTLLTASELGVLKPPPPNLRILISIAPDLDYPLANVPRHLTPCGPIVRAVRPADDAMKAWLAQAPTVYVNLGTHLKATIPEAMGMARALREVVERSEAIGHGRLQVLWKVGRAGGWERDVFEGGWGDVVQALGEYGRVTDWVEAEPKAVLESGRVVCSVNHGGANSFYEALCAGVPQVLLPPWSDCYDFGNRVEMLGVGVWANKKAMPRWSQGELAAALGEVLFGPRAKEMAERASELARRHPEDAGREVAARGIMRILEHDEPKRT
ncbi:hypothetical protein B0T25DRAFT_474923 [Lasiosphaeria hispida]|uniref:Glycosyltransferase family 1 protein n=1 Tax=Lasiosphaeria hispida TaxID=260671 RepID=A0AAJ0MFL2_9PEZI|nr:hypothetical protein B0T25DRAFT_474923 [Lasiosphaeria hispida]